jgi:hypothetical protein
MERARGDESWDDQSGGDSSVGSFRSLGSLGSQVTVSTHASSLAEAAAVAAGTRRHTVNMTSTLAPPLLASYSHRAGQVALASLNGHFNTASVVHTLGSGLGSAHRGKMASRGVYALPTVTALELSNGMPATPQGTRRFHDLGASSALASTLLHEHFLLPTSKHLEPAPSLYRRNAAALLAKQHGDFDDA